MSDAPEDLRGKAARFLPMPGRLAVEPIEEARYGGIMLPPSGMERCTLGRVIALGADPMDDQPSFDGIDSGSTLHLGDVVLFGLNAGSQVDIGIGSGRKRCIFLRTSEVISRVVWEKLPVPEVRAVRSDDSGSFPYMGSDS